MSDKIQLIAFIGKAGSGKTTAAHHLVGDYYRLRFAEALKLMLRFGLGLSHAQVDGAGKNEPCEALCGKTPRQAMITLGTEWGRDMIHHDIWVKSVERTMQQQIKLGQMKFIIDDVRFLNEAIWVKSCETIGLQTKLIRIVRGGHETGITHRSEMEQDSIKEDVIIYNDRDIEHLYSSIDQLLSTME